ncbi:helix-turn-helix domain-containing protein [Rhodanobacter sp. A1T4]|uniref:helix-turn-helix domain-containing protein n=1 Tax=Rhodanobacter sp. A1T4 TaxID=2723087 RepID=UPI001619D98C|nr:helix-turn-helix domain-containing protein [Rhodanobacter sp. A1T4]MBB6248735.1 DNA-binding transcriptional ArsR family regulator [Rhodanobacter sp. A1T4]
MTKKTAIDVLLHPIRLRIVRAFLGEAELTARDLAERLDDVPQATLYRHLNHLAEAGVLIVTAETPVRGAMERTYRLDPNTIKMPPEDIPDIDPDTHLKYFSVFLASLLEDFGRYMRSDDVDVVRDDVHYLQATFLASPEEFVGFMKEMQALIKRFAGLGPAKNRTQRTVSMVTLPERPTKARQRPRPTSSRTRRR